MHKSVITSLALMLAFAALTNCVKKEDCDVYKCDKTRASSGGVCLRVTNTASTGLSKTYSFNFCQKSEVCASSGYELAEDGKEYNCSKSSTSDNDDYDWDFDDFDVDENDFRSDLVHEQKCDNDSQCYNGTCSSGKCNGRDRGAECDDHRHCKVGDACIAGTCQKQREAGESCESSVSANASSNSSLDGDSFSSNLFVGLSYISAEYSCVNSCTCDKGKCVKYNSRANGEVTDDVRTCASASVYVEASASSSDNMFGSSMFSGAMAGTCDEKSLSQENCGSGQDSCVYKWAHSGKTETTECMCQYDENQSRMCMEVMESMDTEYETGVHTTLRFNLTNLFGVDWENLFDNVMGSVSSWFDDDTMECVMEAQYGENWREVTQAFSSDFSATKGGNSKFLSYSLTLFAFITLIFME